MIAIIAAAVPMAIFSKSARVPMNIGDSSFTREYMAKDDAITVMISDILGYEIICSKSLANEAARIALPIIAHNMDDTA
jgi:hypothetical protein